MTTGRGDDPNAPGGSDPVAELEAFIARTEAAGEPVPPEARAMLARLRELMAALQGLTESLGERPTLPPPPRAPGEKPESD